MRMRTCAALLNVCVSRSDDHYPTTMAWLLRTRKLVATTSRFCPKLRAARSVSSVVSYPLQLSSVSENHDAVYNESLANPEAFWGDLARNRLRWMKDFEQVMDCDMSEGRFSWFNGGKLNVSGKLT